MFNQKQIKKLMQQMSAEELRAKSVVIELKDGSSLVIKNPKVTRMKVMGQETFQIVGSAREEVKEEASEAEGTDLREEDVELVASQAGVSDEDAKSALKESGGDLAGAIMRLKEKSSD